MGAHKRDRAFTTQAHTRVQTLLLAISFDAHTHDPQYYTRSKGNGSSASLSSRTLTHTHCETGGDGGGQCVGKNA